MLVVLRPGKPINLNKQSNTERSQEARQRSSENTIFQRQQCQPQTEIDERKWEILQNNRNINEQQQ